MTNRLDFLFDTLDTHFARGKLNAFDRLAFLRRVVELSRGWELQAMGVWLVEFLHCDFIGTLPREIAREILSYLDARSLIRCCGVSRYWRDVALSLSDLWKPFCRRLSLGVDRSVESWSRLYTLHQKRIQLLEASLLQERPVLSGHKKRITALKCCGRTVVTGSLDRTIRVWRLDDGSCTTVIRCGNSYAADLQFDSTFVVAGLHNCTASCWNIESGELIQTYRGHSMSVLCVEFMKSQNIVVTGSADLTIKVWKLREGHCLQSIIASTCNWIRKLILTEAGGDVILISSDTRKVKLWNLTIAEESPVAGEWPLDSDDVYLINDIRLVDGILYIISSQGFDGSIKIPSFRILEHGQITCVVVVAASKRHVRHVLSIGTALSICASDDYGGTGLEIYNWIRGKSVVFFPIIAQSSWFSNIFKGPHVACGNTEWLSGSEDENVEKCREFSILAPEPNGDVNAIDIIPRV